MDADLGAVEWDPERERDMKAISIQQHLQNFNKAPAAVKKKKKEKENDWGEFCEGSDASQAPKIMIKKKKEAPGI